jgi:hypothetical protein
MKTSTARQLEFDGLGNDFAPRLQEHRSLGGAADQSKAGPTVASSTTLQFPDFSGRGEVYAVTSRLAGRINAASISEQEHERLLDERQQLLDKFFSGSMTRKEQRRLEYVRWSLDRIEDAKHGAALDVLDDVVSAYENFSADVSELLQQLAARTGRRR